MLPIGPWTPGSYVAPLRKCADQTAANAAGEGAAGTTWVMARNALLPEGSCRVPVAEPPASGVIAGPSKLEVTTVQSASWKSPSANWTGGAAATDAARANTDTIVGTRTRNLLIAGLGTDGG